MKKNRFAQRSIVFFSCEFLILFFSTTSALYRPKNSKRKVLALQGKTRYSTDTISGYSNNPLLGPLPLVAFKFYLTSQLEKFLISHFRSWRKKILQEKLIYSFYYHNHLLCKWSFNGISVQLNSGNEIECHLFSFFSCNFVFLQSPNK